MACFYAQGYGSNVQSVFHKTSACCARSQHKMFLVTCCINHVIDTITNLAIGLAVGRYGLYGLFCSLKCITSTLLLEPR